MWGRVADFILLLAREDIRAFLRAGLPYYQAAGEKMLEAKLQLKHGEFGDWIKRNFALKERQARLYMELARATSNKEIGSTLPFSSLSDFVREPLIKMEAVTANERHK